MTRQRPFSSLPLPPQRSKPNHLLFFAFLLVLALGQIFVGLGLRVSLVAELNDKALAWAQLTQLLQSNDSRVLEYSTPFKAPGDEERAKYLLESHFARNNNKKVHFESLPGFVKKMDEPFALNLPRLRKRAIITSAIQTRFENAVVFVVIDGPRDGLLNDNLPGIGKDDLPIGFLCAFSSQQQLNPGRKLPDTNQTGTTTPLSVRWTNLHLFRSSSIWSCKLPLDRLTYDTVTIIPPRSTVNVEYGTGTFRVNRDFDFKGLPALVSCGKNIYNIDNRTATDVITHHFHYRRLGVDHFIFYAKQNDDNLASLIRVFQELVRPEGSAVTLYLIPSSYNEIVSELEDLPQRLQLFTTNDCLWKSKGAEWILMQYDIDEILVGVPDLSSYLASQPPSVEAIYIQQHLPRDDIFPLDSDTSPLLTISSGFGFDWGKTMFRPNAVNVAWVHSPTNPRLYRLIPDGIQLLHYRRDRSKMHDFFYKRNMKWVKVDHPYRKAPLKRPDILGFACGYSQNIGNLSFPVPLPGPEDCVDEDFNQMYWNDLNKEALDAAKLLGFAEESWDNDSRIPIYSTPLGDLSDEERKAVKYLGLESYFSERHRSRDSNSSRFRVGDKIVADWEMQGEYYDGVVIDISLDGGSITVRYDDDGSSEDLPSDRVKENPCLGPFPAIPLRLLESKVKRKVPKVLHFVHVDSNFLKNGTSLLPESVIANVDNWQKMNPDWTVRLWTNHDVHNLLDAGIGRDLLEFLVEIAKAPHIPSPFSWMSDLLRYAIVYQFGGLYLDTDSLPIRPLDEMLTTGTFTVCERPALSFPTNATDTMISWDTCHLAGTAVIGAPPSHHSLRDALSESISNSQKALCMMKAGLRHEYNTDVSGPPVWTAVARKGGINLLRSGTFFPCTWEDRSQCNSSFFNSSPGVFAMHAWAHSW